MAATTYAIPQQVKVEETIAGLLGREITCRKAPRLVIAPSTTGVLGQLGHEDGAVFLYVYVDIPLACGMGGALSLISKSEVTASIQAGKPSEGLMENIEEVFNVCRTLFRTQEMHNARLVRLDILPAADLPKDIYKKLLKPVDRLDMEIQIDGYGGGKLSVLATG